MSTSRGEKNSQIGEVTTAPEPPKVDREGQPYYIRPHHHATHDAQHRVEPRPRPGPQGTRAPQG